MTPIKIPIQPIELSLQKPTDISECYLELNDTHLKMKMVFTAEEPVIDGDPNSGRKSAKNNFEVIAKRSMVSGVEKILNEERNNWRVIIYVTGFPNDIKIYARTEDGADRYFSKIKPWIINTENV